MADTITCHRCPAGDTYTVPFDVIGADAMKRHLLDVHGVVGSPAITPDPED
jgi:hypothetical protein